MPETLLDRIKQIILKHIESDRFGVSELAAELGISRSQLFRKIKTTFGKSASVLIREVRLDEGLKLLHDGDFTTSEIAYKVGFSSPSYFNKCFHDRYGFTPGDYKKQIDNEIEIIPKPLPGKYLLSKKKLGVIYVFGIIIMYLAFIIIIPQEGYDSIQEVQDNTRQPLKPKISIAVLPLIDISENKTKDYITEGLADAITLELSKLEDLRVISRGSSMYFKDSSNLNSEVAKKLEVDLLLEGSVTYDSDRLRVIVQLIEVFPQEKYLWANKYDRNTLDIFQLADDISNQVASEINMIISPSYSSITVNHVDPKAYNLYLKGRFLWSKQNPDAVKSAIAHLKESIEIDSCFALAYTILAECYITMNKFSNDEGKQYQNRIQSRNAINKALNKAIELDGSLAEAYITKGNILGQFDWDWEGMKEMAIKGLELSPSNLDGHILISKYYIIKGDFDRALSEALFAEKLHPLNPKISCLAAQIYYLDKQYDKALEKYKKILELHNYGSAWEGIAYIQFITGKKDEAFKSWKELLKIKEYPKMAEYSVKYNEKQILKFWLDMTKNSSSMIYTSPTTIAQVYLFLKEKENALKYLELAFEQRNENLPVTLQLPHLSPLYDDPRFIKLTNKVGVTININPSN
ncbi:MAG: helix-turn-helix domain-containing protein [Bacteroidetes bacterium]|nr:helix-turn-helix domain-containing protein [Bacteroidota bacterium]